MKSTVLGSKTASRARALLGRDHPHGLPVADAEEETTAAVRAAAAAAVAAHLCDHYTRRPGIAPLCAAVARHMTARGAPLGEPDVVIAGSPAEARYVALRALGAGKTVYVHAPSAAPYAAALLFGDARLVWLHENDDLPPDAAGVLLISRTFAASGEPGAAAGGEQPPPPRLQQLAAWAEAANLTVIADETAAPLGGYTPCAALPGMAPRTLTLGGFGGAPGLGAWQVSWFGGPKALLTPVRDLKQSITICTTAPSQYAALAALEEAAGGAAGAPKGVQP